MKVKLNATYKSLAFKRNDIFQIKFVVPADDIIESLKLAAMLEHQEIMLGIKMKNGELIKIGKFAIEHVVLDSYLEVLIELLANINDITFGNLPLNEMNDNSFIIYLNGKKEESNE
jgi:hypothetical protein